MLDRQKVETILERRFPGASHDQVAAAANAIVGLKEEWDEMIGREHELGYYVSAQCGGICYLAREAAQGAEFRFFKRRMDTV